MSPVLSERTSCGIFPGPTSTSQAPGPSRADHLQEGYPPKVGRGRHRKRPLSSARVLPTQPRACPLFGPGGTVLAAQGAGFPKKGHALEGTVGALSRKNQWVHLQDRWTHREGKVQPGPAPLALLKQCSPCTQHSSRALTCLLLCLPPHVLSPHLAYRLRAPWTTRCPVDLFLCLCICAFFPKFPLRSLSSHCERVHTVWDPMPRWEPSVALARMALQ